MDFHRSRKPPEGYVLLMETPEVGDIIGPDMLYWSDENQDWLPVGDSFAGMMWCPQLCAPMARREGDGLQMSVAEYRAKQRW